MTTYEFESEIRQASVLDRFGMGSAERQPNLLLPSTRFTLFALTAIVAGAALAFMT
jgi:hypothetical protein